MIKCFIAHHSGLMERKDRKGSAVSDVLTNAMSLKHFMFLQNGSKYLGNYAKRKKPQLSIWDSSK